jgi:hypothetical protein
MRIGATLHRWRWVLGIGIVVLAFVLMPSVERVHSFAYVARVDVERSVAGGRRTCDVYARLPRLVVLVRPPDHDRAWLSGGSIELQDTINDVSKTCEDYRRTWQPVTYPPGQPEAARINYVVHFDWTDVLFWLGVLGLVIWAVVKRVRAYRAARPIKVKLAEAKLRKRTSDT